jgi:hypothetical protein
MKTTKILRAAVFTSLLLSAPLFLTGCQDVIYSKIMNEVTLDDATISGTVNAIVRFGSNIFIENGNVYYKSASSTTHDSWNSFMTGLTPVSYDYYGRAYNGTYIIKLAADENYLYALGVTYEEDESEGENVASAEYLYYYNGSTWVQGPSVTSGAATIFCTNTPNPSFRKAYIRTGDGVFLLDGAALPSITSVSSLTQQSSTYGAGTSTCSAIYRYSDGAVYFRDEWATGSNAISTTAAGATTTDGTTPLYYYYANGDVLYYSKDPSAFSSNYDLGITSIYSMAVTSDSIILGTAGSGLYKVTNTSGVPGSSIVDFSTNADSALGSPYRILTLLAVDPSATETGAPAIYASADFSGTSSSSTGDYDDIGLWSYYTSRGNWNRE